MKDKLELDPRILEKNLEITRVTKQLDNLQSDYTLLLSQVSDLKERMKSPSMLNTLQECHDILTVSGLGNENGEGLRRELRKVISFLQQ
tara:strand:+ start:411 stop:677 length:267 start_codon:yes stop_codon:yes gene_type:complete